MPGGCRLSKGIRIVLKQEEAWLFLIWPVRPMRLCIRVFGHDEPVDLVLPFLDRTRARFSVGPRHEVVLDYRRCEVAGCSRTPMTHG